LKELDATPEHFTLYGGTALALYLGHRRSVDFDFFSHEPFDPDTLMRSVSYLNAAEPLEISQNSLTCRVDRGGKIKMQFFGGLSIGRVEPRLNPAGATFWAASLLDVAGTKVKVLPERSEEKDYLDVDALLKCDIDLPTMLEGDLWPALQPTPGAQGTDIFCGCPQATCGCERKAHRRSGPRRSWQAARVHDSRAAWSTR
jgi:hypothetical protein